MHISEAYGKQGILISFVLLCQVIGGLLSAHLLSYRLYLDDTNVLNIENNGQNLHHEWPCNGPLLQLAVSAAKKLLPGVLLTLNIILKLFILR